MLATERKYHKKNKKEKEPQHISTHDFTPYGRLQQEARSLNEHPEQRWKTDRLLIDSFPFRLIASFTTTHCDIYVMAGAASSECYSFYKTFHSFCKHAYSGWGCWSLSSYFRVMAGYTTRQFPSPSQGMNKRWTHAPVRQGCQTPGLKDWHQAGFSEILSFLLLRTLIRLENM